MPSLVSQIRWGTGEENTLTFDYPFDNQRFYRKRRLGSQRIRIPGAGYDTWTTGKDYMMEGDVRWLSLAKYTDPVGIEAFLDYAGDDGLFTFVPDVSVPGFTIPGCYLEAPFESPDPGTEQSGEQIVRLVIGNPTYNFAQAMRGLMWEYVPGGNLVDPIAAVVQRATTATRHGRAGLVNEDLVNVLRDRHYEGGRRLTLLEPIRDNSCLWSEELDNAGGWTADGTTVTANAIIAPDGALTMDKLVETAAGPSNHQRWQAITITSDEFVAISTYVAKGERDKLRFIFVEGATGNFFGSNIDLTAKTADTLQLGTGVVSLAPRIVELVDELGIPTGRYRVTITGKLATGVTAGRIYCGLRDASGATSYTGDGTSGAYYWGIQVERLGTSSARMASSYKKTTSATVQRDADVFYRQLLHSRVQPIAVYMAFLETGFRYGAGGGNSVALEVGTLPNADPRITLEAGGGNYSFGFFATPTGSRSSTRAAANVGQFVELLGIIRQGADGSLTAQLVSAIDGGADSVGSESTSLAAGAGVWGSPALAKVGNRGTGSANPSQLALASLKLMPLTYAGITRDTVSKARVA